MESRNILLVVICICAFLVIIFGIGFVWSLPDRTNPLTENYDDNNGSRTDVFQVMNDDTEPPGLEPTEAPKDELSENATEEDKKDAETTGDTEGEKKEQEKKAETEDTVEKNEKEEQVTEKEKDSKGDTVYIPVPKGNEPSSRYEPSSTDEPSSRDEPSSTDEPSSRDEPSTSYPKTWIVKPQPTPGTTATPRRKKRVVEYWIQAGSFISRSRADDLNQKLAEHGFQGQVQTRELNNVTHYRVRVGPYQNKSEAEKFLEWLKVLDGMQGSMIYEVPTDKWVS